MRKLLIFSAIACLAVVGMTSPVAPSTSYLAGCPCKDKNKDKKQTPKKSLCGDCHLACDCDQSEENSSQG